MGRVSALSAFGLGLALASCADIAGISGDGTAPSPDLDASALGDAPAFMVDAAQPRKGGEPNTVERVAEESDAGMVPKKSAKTRVTPVESVEGRAAAEGKSVDHHLAHLVVHGVLHLVGHFLVGGRPLGEHAQAARQVAPEGHLLNPPP